MTLQEQIDQLNHIVFAALAGNFDLSPNINEYDADLSEFVQNITALLENQKNFVAETQVTSSRILSASEDLALTLEENNGLMGELSAYSEKISALNDLSYRSTAEAIDTIKEIVADIEQVHKHSQGAIAVGTDAEEAVKEGTARIRSILELVNAMETGSRKTVEYVDKFGESTKEIAKILKVVHEITRETEILSFNASIESKRAGVAGRGFGVIAGAIRDLAEKSRTEVTEIGNVVEEINDGLRTLTGNIHADFKNVEQSVAHTKMLEDSLHLIRQTFTKLREEVGGIIQSSEAQGLLAANMSEKITGVEENSELVKTGFGNVYDAIKKQKDSMDGLNTLGNYLLSSANEMTGILKNASVAEYDSEEIERAATQVFTLLKNEALSNERFAQLDPAVHKQVLDRLLARDILEAVWSNDAKGRFIYSNPPAGIKNARVRDWFRESIEGRAFTSEVYVSAITRKPCITVSLPILRDGQCVGVLGADLRLEA